MQELEFFCPVTPSNNTVTGRRSRFVSVTGRSVPLRPLMPKRLASEKSPSRIMLISSPANIITHTAPCRYLSF